MSDSIKLIIKKEKTISAYAIHTDMMLVGDSLAISQEYTFRNGDIL